MKTLVLHQSEGPALQDAAGSFQNAMFGDPLAPVLKPESENKMQGIPITSITNTPLTYSRGNPALDVELLNVKENKLTLVGNIYADVSILKDFVFRSSYGFNIAYADWSQYSPSYFLSPGNGQALSTLNSQNYRVNGWISEKPPIINHLRIIQ